MTLTLRPLVAADAEPLALLAQHEGRNVHLREYARFLELEGASGLAIEEDAQLVGGITAMRYFEHGFLGPPLVRRGADAVGLSLLLLGRAVEGLLRSGATYVETEASPDETPLLRPLGFTVQRRTLVFERPPGRVEGAGETEPLADHHLLDVGILDATVAGYGRKGYIAALRDDLPSAARVRAQDGEVDGYVAARASLRGHQLGPLVTREPSLDAARELLHDALAPICDGPVVALVPEPSAFLDEMRRAGFAQVGTLERLRAGPALPGDETARATEWLLGGRITG